VILSDDLEMKAIAKTYAVPEQRCRRCRGMRRVLVCSGDVELQAATLEALVRGVEQQRIPYKRWRMRRPPAAREGAVPRAAGRRAGAAVVAQPGARLRCRISGSREEMARFAE
jgi:hypothetical protein